MQKEFRSHRMPESFKGTVVAHSYGEGIVGIEDGDGWYSKCFVKLNGEPIFSFFDKKIDIMCFETGFVSGKARVSIYAHDSRYRRLDGYYDAVITSVGEIVSQKWVDCDMRESDYNDNDCSDITSKIIIICFLGAYIERKGLHKSSMRKKPMFFSILRVKTINVTKIMRPSQNYF